MHNRLSSCPGASGVTRFVRQSPRRSSPPPDPLPGLKAALRGLTHEGLIIIIYDQIQTDHEGVVSQPGYTLSKPSNGPNDRDHLSGAEESTLGCPARDGPSTSRGDERGHRTAPRRALLPDRRGSARRTRALWRPRAGLKLPSAGWRKRANGLNTRGPTRAEATGSCASKRTTPPSTRSRVSSSPADTASRRSTTSACYYTAEEAGETIPADVETASSLTAYAGESRYSFDRDPEEVAVGDGGAPGGGAPSGNRHPLGRRTDRATAQLKAAQPRTRSGGNQTPLALFVRSRIRGL